MTFEIGDRVIDTAGDYSGLGRITGLPEENRAHVVFDQYPGEVQLRHYENLRNLSGEARKNIPDGVNPNHYKFPGGAEVKDISGHLTSFGGQALQYIARATRLDGNNKGSAIEDLKKSLKFIQWEIERLEAQ